MKKKKKYIFFLLTVGYYPSSEVVRLKIYHEQSQEPPSAKPSQENWFA